MTSAEVQIPIYRLPRQQGVLQVIPFIDFGMAWNSSGRQNPDSNTLLGVGLGVQWRQSDRFIARFEYGIPLIEVDSSDRTLQEKGLYFSVQYSPF
ncbi:BamA/TamA family outer membrane protein [Microseira wollei]|uniref:BamA/TamA family outer membrane protein n=1 Tax=Microseira wollei TaxID=467598 RepID=UPI001CFCB056|nr:BamA/TamA family outer membrane protein [Microseira wollei]